MKQYSSRPINIGFSSCIAMESNSRVEVLAGILFATKGGTTKAQIVSESFFTPSEVQQCLCFLLQSGLIQEENGNGRFRPTKEGASLIEEYERIDRTIEGRLMLPLTS
jgi:predicted transcriptional regulator